MQKIKSIEFLRIIFMLAILWMHLSIRFINIYSDNSILNYFATHASNGGKAVDAFFILSGFLFILTFKNSTTVINFIKTKFVRLSPVIIFASLVGAVAGIFKLIHFSLPAAVFNITLTNSIVGIESLKYWNSLQATWYVSAMFWVLLVYFGVIRTFDKKYANLIIGICTILSWYLVLHLNQGSLGNPSKSYYYIFNVGILRAFGGIGIGYFIGEWYKNNIDNIKTQLISAKHKMVYSFFEFAMLVICTLELFILSERDCYNFSIIIYLTILIWLFVQQKGFVSQFFSKDWCVICGRYTYSIYVLHVLVFDILKELGFIKSLGIYSLIPVLIIPIIAGIITYHLVEKPCADYLRKIIIRGELS